MARRGYALYRNSLGTRHARVGRCKPEHPAVPRSDILAIVCTVVAWYPSPAASQSARCVRQYTLNEVPATYSAAKGECASGGGRLAEFSTFAQFQHYLSVFPPTYQHQRVTSWIGWRVQPGGEWGWDSGMAPGIFASPRYAGELPGHDSDISFDPDGTLGALYFSTSRWYNNVPTIAKQDGSTVLPYVCMRTCGSCVGLLVRIRPASDSSRRGRATPHRSHVLGVGCHPRAPDKPVVHDVVRVRATRGTDRRRHGAEHQLPALVHECVPGC